MSILSEQQFQQIIAVVREAGRLLFDRAATRAIENKGPTDFVTDVDLTVQKTLKAKLAELTPEIAFVGEENASAIDLSQNLWILDPVDGTTNLIHNLQHSAISLALVEQGTVTAGIVYNPFVEEMYTALKGAGARLNGAPIAVSGTCELADALMHVGTNAGHRELADISFRWLRTFYDKARDIRRFGSAALDLCYVACGRGDGFVEKALMPWDVAAGILILEEAGGTTSAEDGTPIPLDRLSSVVASNGKIHPEILANL